VGSGIHEDIDFTNFTQRAANFKFEIEIDADFADQAESFRRKQRGKLTRKWRRLSSQRGDLIFDYKATHRYSHQGNRGLARMHRAVIISVERAQSPVSFRDSKLSFDVHLKPHQSWHTCVKFIPVFDGKRMPPLYGCRQFFGTRNQLDRKRQLFLDESTRFRTDEVHPKLSSIVQSALLQATLAGKGHFFPPRWRTAHCANCPNGKDESKMIGGTSNQAGCCTRPIPVHSQRSTIIRGPVTTVPPRLLRFIR
jgi:hypothetical protein